MYSKEKMLLIIPPNVSRITEKLKNEGFKAYLIGGCTRDLIIGKRPKDWDVTTDATPEEILKIFGEESFYENKYGTVGVKNEGETDETLRIIEVTTFRLESAYSDRRRPDAVLFSKKIEDDLQRRDFTINAIAIDIKSVKDNKHEGHIIDLYGGQSDLSKGLIRTVGKQKDRFNEDALRILRAVRLATELDFSIEPETEKEIASSAHLLKNIAKERLRDEFSKIVLSDNPMRGLTLSHKLAILPYISRDLEKTSGVEQNRTHKYDVWEHLARSLQHAADKKLTLEVRLAALFHDIGKPKSRRWSEKKKDWTFHGHEVIGEKITRKNLEELKLPSKTVAVVCKLVRWHMFFSDTEQITLSAVRRIMANVGKDQIWNLLDVRMCDRIGTGRPKENPYRLRKYTSFIEQVMTDPISVAMLKIDGVEVMKMTNLQPGPKIGHILHALLEEVLEDPQKNTGEYLKNRSLFLAGLTEKELKELGNRGKEKKQSVEENEIRKIRKKYHVH